MKLKTLLFLFVLALLQVPAFSQTFEDEAENLNNWLTERVRNAENGILEDVEMPLAVRSLGWGCRCPEYFIGVSPHVQEGPWITPVGADSLPESTREGHSLWVNGYFTGKLIEVDLRDENGEPEEWLYVTPEFKVISWKENELGYDCPAPKATVVEPKG